MSVTKRIIPALDIKDGQLVKGTNFVNLSRLGDPVAKAEFYQNQGADELVFLDIAASREKRSTILDLVEKVSKKVFIPLTVGGGIKELAEMKKIIALGADKIFLNSAAVADPELISKGARVFGSQAIVGAVDAKWDDRKKFYRVYIKGATQATDLDAIAWSQKMVQLGAGELMITSIDADGTKNGYDIGLYQKISEIVNAPIIASGGAGKIKDFVDLFKNTQVQAALAASIFHFNKIGIPELKNNLSSEGVNVRV